MGPVVQIVGVRGEEGDDGDGGVKGDEDAILEYDDVRNDDCVGFVSDAVVQLHFRFLLKCYHLRWMLS